MARNDPFEVVVYDVSNYGSAAVVERQTYDGLEQEARSLAYDGAAGVFYTTAVRTKSASRVRNTGSAPKTIDRLCHCNITLDSCSMLSCNVCISLLLRCNVRRPITVLMLMVSIWRLFFTGQFHI